MKIIRGELTDTAVTPPNTRYDATCDCIQVTTDGGSTWQEAVGQDPRSQPAYLKPALATADPQCDAAANMTAWVKSVVDGLIAALTAGATDLLMANGILQIIEQIFPFAAYFINLMFQLAVDVLAVGAADLNTAFDSTTYDQLTCIFYCHIGGDGQASASQVLDIGADVVANLNTTAALVVGELLFLVGFVGLSNVGATGSETGDCSGCACAWCYEWDFTANDGGWAPTVISGLNFAVYSAGVGWTCRVQDDGCSNHAYMYMNLAISPTSSRLTELEFIFSTAIGSFDNTAVYQFLSGSIVNTTNFDNGVATTHTATLANVTQDDLNVTLNMCGAPSGFTCIGARLHGINDLPTLTGGAPC